MPERISVIFPITEERGLTEEAVARWVKQSLPPRETEVILVSGDGVAPPATVVRWLRPHDRVVTARLANQSAIYDAGIRAARGELVFLTESHCLPAADCLEATVRFLAQHPDLAGAATHSLAECENAYAQIDADTFYDGFREFMQPGDWRKLNVHGFAMRRDVYLALGGLQHRYGRFAEMMLAAALRDQGYQLGYAKDAVIHHHYRGSLGELIAGIDDYVRGESLYRAEYPGPDRIGYTYLPELSNPRSSRAAALQGELAATLLTGVFGKTTAVAGLGLRVATGAATRLLGSRGATVAAWLAVLATRLRCWRFRHDTKRLDPQYRELFRRAAVLSRLRALAAQPLVERGAPCSTRVIGIEEIPDWSLYGFHATERWQGRAFRWSSPVAAIRLPLASGEYRVRLETCGVRSHHYPVNLRVALNGERIPVNELADGIYEIPLAARRCRPRMQTLMWMCDPLRPWDVGVRDHRELGLPIFTIDVQPVS